MLLYRPIISGPSAQFILGQNSVGTSAVLKNADICGKREVYRVELDN